MGTLTLALSGGGAAGIGHVPVLQALDEIGVRPTAIAGTSIGAVVGACYAGGMTGEAIRAHVATLMEDPLATARRFWRNASFRHGAPALSIDPEATILAVLPEALPERIEDLDIPMTVTATDYHARRSVRFTEGPLRKVLAASIALPAIFRPVQIDGRVLIDGGVTENLPVRALPPSDVCLAVDVATEPPSHNGGVPGPAELLAGSLRIMMRALLSESLNGRDGVLLVEPDTRGFRALEFQRWEEILQTADEARAKVRRDLPPMLGMD
ncbi:patatin-like phospholipase family protein [Palleronia sp. KMU-117]|uniref:patatin-like phospholipase family protein n=1 Tax=Palleronia sp. KMU-117 TaxID=3434108 RepID=UPI003D714010